MFLSLAYWQAFGSYGSLRKQCLLFLFRIPLNHSNCPQCRLSSQQLNQNRKNLSCNGSSHLQACLFQFEAVLNMCMHVMSSLKWSVPLLAIYANWKSFFTPLWCSQQQSRAGQSGAFWSRPSPSKLWSIALSIRLAIFWIERSEKIAWNMWCSG